MEYTFPKAEDSSVQEYVFLCFLPRKQAAPHWERPACIHARFSIGLQKKQQLLSAGYMLTGADMRKQH